jgi:uncharacterized protein YdhG (YjbR/CyaY superfamily)
MEAVDDYLSKVKEPEKLELERVRKVIKVAVPDATEAISYGMPAFKYKGKYLIAYAPFKDHLSIFPGSSAVDSFQGELKNYKTSKGTIQFTLDKPIPDKLIKEIVLARVAEINK